MLTLADLIADPAHHLFAFEGEQALFAHMDRDAYERSIFLDSNIRPASRRIIRSPTSDLLEQARRKPPLAGRIGWIFHVAHCGSTLLARALDRPGRLLSLREPLTLRQLGVDRGASPDETWAERLELTCRLLGRPTQAGEAVVVKANVPVNPIIPDLAARSATDPMILLYFPLEAYLLAVLRTPKHRAWVDRIADELADWLSPAAVRRPEGTAERAALLWLAQMSAFDRALGARQNARSLDADTLFAHPVEAAVAAGDLFGAPFTADERDQLSRSELLTEYSKTPGLKFDEDARRARQQAVRAALEPDVRAARAFVEATTWRNGTVPARLTRPLIGDPPLLLHD